MLTPETMELLEENISSKLSDIAFSNIGLDMSPWARETTERLNKWDYIKLKSFLHSKGNHQQNEKTTYWMKEDIHQWYIQQGVSIQNI